MVLIKRLSLSGIHFGMTRRGVGFFLLSAILFLVGFYRKEGVILLWATFFLFLLSYFALVLLFKSIYLGVSGSVESRDSAGILSQDVFVENENQGSANYNLRGFPIIGLFACMRFVFSWKHNKIPVLCPLRHGNNSLSFNLTPLVSGCYTSEVWLQWQDVTGFFLLKARTMEDCIPALRFWAWPVSPENLQENIVKKIPKLQRPFDVREYQPHDDVRRLHWKHFARTEKLYVRTDQEELNTKEKLFIADLSCSKEPDFAFRGIKEFVKNFGSEVKKSLGQGVICRIICPGTNTRIVPGQTKKLMRILSSLWWCKPGELQVTKNNNIDSIILCATAFSTDSEKIAGELGRASVSVKMVDIPREKTAGKFSIKSLFYIPGERPGLEV